MSNNMLGSPATLRKLWNGPLADLMVKLVGRNADKVVAELGKFSRGEPCWVPKKNDTKENREEPPVRIPYANFRSSPRELFGEGHDGLFMRSKQSLEFTEEAILDLSRVRLIPAGKVRSAEMERKELRDRGYVLLGHMAFAACWAHSHQLPKFWREYGCIWFDGTLLESPNPSGHNPADHQWCVGMGYGSFGWDWQLLKLRQSGRATLTDCSAVYV